MSLFMLFSFMNECNTFQYHYKGRMIKQKRRDTGNMIFISVPDLALNVVV